jgi:hypothetical protein
MTKHSQASRQVMGQYIGRDVHDVSEDVKSAYRVTTSAKEKSPDLLYSKQWRVSGLAQHARPQRDCSVLA